MKLSDYEKQVRVFARYPHASMGNDGALTYCALGLCGEAGEYAEKIKKKIRDGTFDKDLALKELGDALWYITCSSLELGSSLEEVAQINIDKLTSREARGVLKGSGDSR
jgi:NTP pyrophosphatase (non-canonical NTP hydrolase)